MTDLFAILFAVWTPASVLSAVAGGVLFGFLLAPLDSGRYQVGRTVLVTIGIGALFQLVFWTGQFVDTYAVSGPALAWRVFSRFALSLVYVVAIAVGSGVGLRRARGHWR